MLKWKPSSVGLVMGSTLVALLMLEGALRLHVAVQQRSRPPARTLERPVPGPPPDGALRIVCVGDSYTRGSGLDPSQAYPAQLAERLAGDGVEILNFGVPGTNTVNQIPMVRDAVETYGADIVLLGFFANDAEAGVVRADTLDARPERRPSLGTRVRRIRNRSYLLRVLSPRINSALYRMGVQLPGAVAYAPSLNAVYRESKPGFERCKSALRTMRDECAARDVRLLVLVMPVITTFGDAYPLRPYHIAVTEFCGSAGIPVLDTLPAFTGQSPWKLRLSMLDAHPNEDGYRLIADAAAAELRRLGWLTRS